jgi:hypothetical protein
VVVNANGGQRMVVNNASEVVNRSQDRHRKTDERKRYQREWMRKFREGSKEAL